MAMRARDRRHAGRPLRQASRRWSKADGRPDQLQVDDRRRRRRHLRRLRRVRHRSSRAAASTAPSPTPAPTRSTRSSACSRRTSRTTRAASGRSTSPRPRLASSTPCRPASVNSRTLTGWHIHTLIFRALAPGPAGSRPGRQRADVHAPRLRHATPTAPVRRPLLHRRRPRRRRRSRRLGPTTASRPAPATSRSRSSRRGAQSWSRSAR